MDFLLDALTNWLKEMLVGGIMGNLTGMFDSVTSRSRIYPYRWARPRRGGTAAFSV